MSIDDITEKIIADAKTQSDEIHKRAQVVVGKMLEELNGEKEKAKALSEEQFDRQLKKASDSIVSVTKQQSVMEREAIIREEIDSAFNTNYRWLISLESDDYVKVLMKLIDNSSLKNSSFDICHTPSKRQRETDKALSLTNIKCEEIQSVQDEKFQGGLKLESQREYHDLSFETLTSTVQTKKEKKISRLLLTK